MACTEAPLQSDGLSHRLRLAARQRVIAQGLSRYGLQDKAVQILAGMFEAGMQFDLHRMPELFCGFPQDPGEGPILYPVACAPQAWSAASVFLLLQACLGLEVSGVEKQVYFTRPHLRRSLARCGFTILRWAMATSTLLLVHRDQDLSVDVIRRQGDVQVVVVK
ncbi:MAG: hypothetical protein WDO18_09615 [Acidobacteriota bacterium]